SAARLIVRLAVVAGSCAVAAIVAWTPIVPAAWLKRSSIGERRQVSLRWPSSVNATSPVVGTEASMSLDRPSWVRLTCMLTRECGGSARAGPGVLGGRGGYRASLQAALRRKEVKRVPQTNRPRTVMSRCYHRAHGFQKAGRLPVSAGYIERPAVDGQVAQLL